MLKRTTRPQTDVPRLAGALLAVALSCVAAHAAPAVREVPNGNAVAFDQLSVSGNACGPAALLNAFRFGDKSWQQGVSVIDGDSDKTRLLTTIRTWGLQPSTSLPGRRRWSRNGVNADDLCDMANEIGRLKFLPRLSREVFMAQPAESQPQLLRRAHSRLSTSLAKGLPPVISIRRIVQRKVPGKPPEWIVLQGHFVTVTRLPAKLDRDADSFEVGYIDPWGGRPATGRIAQSKRAFVIAPEAPSPCLEADFPSADVGKKHVSKGETSILTLAAGIGKW